MRISHLSVDDLFRHESFPGNWEQLLREIQEFEPTATTILAWRWPPKDKTGRVESLALGPYAQTFEALAAAILEGSADPLGGLPRAVGNPGSFNSAPPNEGVIGPFCIAQTSPDGAADATFTFTALDLGDGLAARLAIGLPSSSAPASSVIDQILAPQLPHLRRAFRSLLDYRALQETCDEVAALADVAADPILLVTRDGLLLAANGKGRTLLDAATFANLPRDGRVTLSSGEQTAALRRALTALDGKPASGPAALRLSGASDAAQHWLLVSAAGDGRLALTFKTVTDGELVPMPVLMRSFDLTKTEARLVAAVSAGQTIKDYALSIGRTENTVRWHLGNVFEKMGCRNQTDVVRLVLRLLVS